ncbi:hypothetical protein [Microtetraspora fusca]|uniref:Uncharacterized protein n=1 Tax=Microtetraspora fusca TaxID=1997 RepID=A0ABW6V0U8_MICFU|nr:hypothetical protein [Microtetraspora fusca]
MNPEGNVEVAGNFVRGAAGTVAESRRAAAAVGRAGAPAPSPSGAGREE